MARIFDCRRKSTLALRRRKAALLRRLRVPPEAVRASVVERYGTCGKSNCRCHRGHKHGPFHYLVQCLAPGRIEKFLLKDAAQRRRALAAVAAHLGLHEGIEELSQINTELLRRGESLSG